MLSRRNSIILVLGYPQRVLYFCVLGTPPWTKEQPNQLKHLIIRLQLPSFSTDTVQPVSLTLPQSSCYDTVQTVSLTLPQSSCCDTVQTVSFTLPQSLCDDTVQRSISLLLSFCYNTIQPANLTLPPSFCNGRVTWDWITGAFPPYDLGWLGVKCR